jgi:hypothetical protein
MELAALSDRAILDLDWYYQIELRPGIFTKGNRWLNILPTRKLLAEVPAAERDVLDIGTM